MYVYIYIFATDHIFILYLHWNYLNFLETFNFGNIPNIPTVSRLMDRTAAPPAETNKHSNHEEKTGGSNVHAATFKQKPELVAERGCLL